MNYDEYLNASNGLGEAVRANVVVEREVGSIEINVDSVLNWPYKFIATSGMLDIDTGTFDPETVTVFYGHINGTYIEIDEFAPGYPDIGNQANEIIVLKPTTAWADGVANRVALPPGGTTGQVLAKASDDDGDAEWQNSVNFSPKEVPTGLVNGVNKAFTTSRPFIANTLSAFVNGLNEGFFVTEVNPATGQFEFDVAPAVGSDIFVEYWFGQTSTNEADVLDGFHASTTPGSNTIPAVDASGDLHIPGKVYSDGTQVTTLRDIMIINFATSPTYTKINVNWTAVPFPFDKSYATLGTDSKLEFSGNGIKIGAGVSLVKIDSMIGYYAEGSTADIVPVLFKNGVVTADHLGYSSMTVQYGQVVGMPIYMAVAENDVLRLGVNGNSTTNRRYFESTYLQVEVLQ